MAIQKIRWEDFQIIFVTFLVAILNTSIFTAVNYSRFTQVNEVNNLITTLFIYGLFLVVCFFIIIIKKTQLLKYSFYALLIVMTFHIFQNLYFLIANPHIQDNGIAILTDAVAIWFVSVIVFALWYWTVDRGGPIARFLDMEGYRSDLLFPQKQTTVPGWENWKPKFIDYLFFSFFTSSSFAPADTLPLSNRVKLLMMAEALISLIIIGMVASRAINLLQ